MTMMMMWRRGDPDINLNGPPSRRAGDDYRGAAEVLRQAMLQHDFVFRHQVAELHRLYWTQKSMMTELSRGSINVPSQEPTSFRAVDLAGEELLLHESCKSQKFTSTSSGVLAPDLPYFGCESSHRSALSGVVSWKERWNNSSQVNSPSILSRGIEWKGNSSSSDLSELKEVGASPPYSSFAIKLHSVSHVPIDLNEAIDVEFPLDLHDNSPKHQEPTTFSETSREKNSISVTTINDFAIPIPSYTCSGKDKGLASGETAIQFCSIVSEAVSFERITPEESCKVVELDGEHRGKVNEITNRNAMGNSGNNTENCNLLASMGHSRNEESTSNRIESFVEVSQAKQEPVLKEVITNELEDEMERLVIKAAEILVQMSLQKCSSEPSAVAPVSEYRLCSSDTFESITLTLPECKDHEFTSPWRVPEGSPARVRRGRGLPDFQKEILPGIVSLSRHEICKDMHNLRYVLRSRKIGEAGWFAPVTSRRTRRSSARRN